jgi:hypothetical protein
MLGDSGGSMSIVDRDYGSSVRTGPKDIPKWLLGPIGRMLRTGDPAATLDRLFISQHVKDLRLIVVFGGIAAVAIFGAGVPIALANVMIAHPDWHFIRVAFSALGSFLAFFTPVLGVFGLVLGWAYQAGSARLGIVDLYACEITTLCRVATTVDSVRRSIETFEHGLDGRNGAGKAKVRTTHFTSEESYFSVFENNTRDLQALEAPVVANITAFYTYMKAVRDSTRALMEMSAPPARPGLRSDQASTNTPWHEAVRNVIYMTFLGLESARQAIGDLVEFEPDEAERTIVILISELEAYRFLRDQYADENDVRHQRLALRDAVYREVMPRLYRDVDAGKASEPTRWEPALRLVPELKRRYDSIINGPIQTAVVKRPDLRQPASTDALAATYAAFEPMNLPTPRPAYLS